MLLLAVIYTSISYSQTLKDSIAIEQAMLNYALGWYEANAELMEEAVYHDFQKRHISVDEKGKTKIFGNTAMSMYQKTRKRAEKAIPHDEAVLKIKEKGILSVSGNIAAGYIKSDSWMDYILFAKINGEWKMMNVVWQKL